MWIWSEYISDNRDYEPAVFYSYAHIWGQWRGPKLDVRSLLLTFNFIKQIIFLKILYFFLSFRPCFRNFLIQTMY